MALLISGGNLLFPRLPILIVIVVLYLVARNWVIDFKRRMVPVLLLLGCVLMLTMLRPMGADFQSTAIRFANFIAGGLLLDLYLRSGSDSLRRDLYLILHLMAWQALITVVLAECFNFLFLPFPVAETPYSTFLGLFTYHIMQDDLTTIIRPDGIFYEPGVFQVYLNLFVYLALFVFKNTWKSFLGVAAVFSTQSTTGVVICFAIVSTYIATNYLNRGSLPVRVAKVFAAAVLVVSLGMVAAINVQNKLTGDSQGSFWARQYDLLTGINIISAHPWLGIGFDYDQYRRASNQFGYSETMLTERILQEHGNSNGLVFLLYSVGIPLSLPFFVGMFRQTLFPNRALFGAVLVLAFFGESMIFTPFFLMIIFSGLLARNRTGGAPVLAHGL